jgi:hypothetical protein
MELTLLHLPPEVRNLIYHLVLGNLHLHVSRKSLRSRVCGDPTSYRRRAREIKKSCGDGRSITPWSPHHYCYETEEDRRHGETPLHGQKRAMSLGLLVTCRQVHNEAALMPFMLNTFVFDTCETFGNFIAILTPIQARVIRSVILESITAGVIRQEAMLMVRGMRHVLVFGLFFSLDLGRRYNETGLRNLLLFESTPLHSVEVCFEFLSLGGLRSPIDLRSLETELERLIISSRPDSFP